MPEREWIHVSNLGLVQYSVWPVNTLSAAFWVFFFFAVVFQDEIVNVILQFLHCDRA